MDDEPKTPPKTPDDRPPIRYSPRPVHAYVKFLGDRMHFRVAGIGANADVQRHVYLWNLLWLSFDFDAHVQHPDPYVVGVMRDTLAQEPCLEEWLHLPAPTFIGLLQGMEPERLHKLWAYRTYGQEWVSTMVARSYRAQPVREVKATPLAPGGAVPATPPTPTTPLTPTQAVPVQSLGLLIQAVQFAADRYRDCRRRSRDRDASPYIDQTIAVAQILAIEGGVGDVVVLCAGVLHDVLQVTATTPGELATRFGDEVAVIATELSVDFSVPLATRMQRQIKDAPGLSDGARLVKLAVLICRLREVAALPPSNWAAYEQREFADWSGRMVNALRGAHDTLEAIFDAQHARLMASLGS